MRIVFVVLCVIALSWGAGIAIADEVGPGLDPQGITVSDEPRGEVGPTLDPDGFKLEIADFSS